MWSTSDLHLLCQSLHGLPCNFSEPNVLLDPMDPSDLESWECGPLLPEAQQ